MENTVTLRISRAEGIAENVDVAIIKLNNFRHIIGQPVMVCYKKSDGSVDAITVVGIKNGIGRNCYSIISTSGISVVSKVFDSLPDVSQLVHGEMYIGRYDGEWVKIYLKDSERVEVLNRLSDGHLRAESDQLTGRTYVAPTDFMAGSKHTVKVR